MSNNKPDLVVIDYETFIGLPENIESKKEPTQKKNDFSEFSGKWSKKGAEEFDKIIEDAFEQINPEGLRL